MCYPGMLEHERKIWKNARCRDCGAHPVVPGVTRTVLKSPVTKWFELGGQKHCKVLEEGIFICQYCVEKMPKDSNGWYLIDTRLTKDC